MTVARQPINLWARFEREEDGTWVSSVPPLGGISTWGETWEEVVKNTREAIELYLETLAELGQDLPDDADMPLPEGVQDAQILDMAPAVHPAWRRVEIPTPPAPPRVEAG